MTQPKTKPIIAVDIDDVLMPTNDAIRRYVNEHFGTNFTHEEHTAPGAYVGYFERVWGVGHDTADNWYNSFIKSGALVDMQPIDGAIEVLAGLGKNYQLVVVSARYEDQVEMTHQWLLKHFPAVFKDVRFISGWYQGRQVSKGDVCREIGATFLIDDHIDHCLEAEKAGVKALLFGEYGWSKNNKAAKNLTRLRDWRDIKKFFNEER